MLALPQLCVITLLAAAVSPAAALTDDATGFGVNPPPPYKAERSNQPQTDVQFSVDSTTGSPPSVGKGAHLCAAAFKKIPAYAGSSQPDINRLVANKDWRDAARAVIEADSTITSETEFKLQESRGVEYILQPKSGAGVGNTVTTISIVQTPKGRVSFYCATTRAGLEQALESFREIRSTITLPK